MYVQYFTKYSKKAMSPVTRKLWAKTTQDDITSPALLCRCHRSVFVTLSSYCSHAKTWNWKLIFQFACVSIASHYLWLSIDFLKTVYSCQVTTAEQDTPWVQSKTEALKCTPLSCRDLQTKLDVNWTPLSNFLNEHETALNQDKKTHKLLKYIFLVQRYHMCTN
jgi:hypothetical protein